MEKIPIISIEGVIGIGKSTLCRKLEERGYPISEEPVSEWLGTFDEYGKNIIDYLYADIEKFGFPMQIFAFISKCKMLMNTMLKNIEHKPIFVERCIFTDKECFAKNLRESKKMTDIEWIIYQKCFEYITETFEPKVPKPTAYIYLRTTDIKCVMDRIKTRGRDAEATISSDYILSLHKKHDEWMFKNVEKEIPVLTIDVSLDESKDDNLWTDMIEKIEEWIKVIKFSSK